MIMVMIWLYCLQRSVGWHFCLEMIFEKITITILCEKVQEGGGVVSSKSFAAAAKDIVAAYDQSNLHGKI